ncbi:MAG: MarR family transcriptional regulator [Methanotrichaceae archaeon]
MDELIGFVLGHKQREKVIQVLEARGSMTSRKMAKLGRLSGSSVERVLKEMEEKGLVKDENDNWSLTEMGAQVQKEMKRRM